MQKIVLTFLLLIFFLGCTSKEPTLDCKNAGKFIMTLKNEEGRIKFDTTSKKFLILSSPDGSLEYNTVAIPCNLKPEFQLEYLVRFDADFFELKNEDSLIFPKNAFSMYIKKIEFIP